MAQSRRGNTPAERISRLVRRGGYPVPYFVAWFKDGKQVKTNAPGAEPDFRVVSQLAHHECITKNRCWICGETIGANKSFVFGPMAACHGLSMEPPSHRECALYAVVTCPHMLKAGRVAREHNLPSGPEVVTFENVEKDNPGLWVIWTTKRYTLKPGNLMEVGPPVSVEWWTEGKPADRAFVETQVSNLVAADFDRYCERYNASKNQAAMMSPVTHLSNMSRRADGLIKYYPKA